MNIANYVSVHWKNKNDKLSLKLSFMDPKLNLQRIWSFDAEKDEDPRICLMRLYNEYITAIDTYDCRVELHFPDEEVLSDFWYMLLWVTLVQSLKK